MPSGVQSSLLGLSQMASTLFSGPSFRHPSSLHGWEGTPAPFSKWLALERGGALLPFCSRGVRTPFSLFLNFLPYELVTICKIFIFTTNPYNTLIFRGCTGSLCKMEKDVFKYRI